MADSRARAADGTFRLDQQAPQATVEAVRGYLKRPGAGCVAVDTTGLPARDALPIVLQLAGVDGDVTLYVDAGLQRLARMCALDRFMTLKATVG